MKKIFFNLTKGVIPFVVMVSFSHAQTSTNTVVYAKPEKNVPQAKDANAADTTGSVLTDPANNAADITIISKRAIKNLKAEAQNAEAVRWHKIHNGFIAYYREDGIKNRAYYSKNGNWHYTIRNYDEAKLPRDVRAIVKRSYYDFSIYGVQEIHVENKTIYLVYVKDETTMKTVRVCDGEMEEIESFKNTR